jgi:hypothetical protein
MRQGESSVVIIHQQQYFRAGRCHGPTEWVQHGFTHQSGRRRPRGCLRWPLGALREPHQVAELLGAIPHGLQAQSYMGHQHNVISWLCFFTPVCPLQRLCGVRPGHTHAHANKRATAGMPAVAVVRTALPSHMA